ncbi:S8 family serine peptidase, partial [Clostridium sp.]
MKGKSTRRLLSAILVASLSLTNFGISTAFAQNNKEVGASSIESLLEKLPENYKNYLKASTGSKLKIDKSIDLSKETIINIIVELKSDPMAVQASKKNQGLYSVPKNLNDEHEEFKQSFQQSLKSSVRSNAKTVSNVKFGYEFTEVFNGIAMSVPANEIEKLAEMDMVKTIWSDVEVHLELPEVDEDSYLTTDGVTPYMFDSIPGIGADKLHDEGIKGKGIKVGVLDTGVDYNHPDLKSAYKGGYDFIDNDNDPMETTYKDWQGSGKPEFNSDGTPYYTAHGTHVAGTILGRGENPGVDAAITGVAPEADLYAYRVLGKYGSGGTQGILAGIDKAIKDGMDVINLSLGMSWNNALTPEAVAINNCMLYTDTVAVVAAGNSGSNAYTVGSPGTAPLAITVGANNSEMKIDTIDAKFMDTEYNLKFFAKNWTDKVENLLVEKLPIEFVGLGNKKDFEGKDLTGKIALIQRGELAFVEKIANAKAAGAEYAIIYNNVDGDIAIYLGESNDYITSLTLSKAQGEMLKTAVLSAEAKGKVVTFENIGQIVQEGNKLASFSSRGPVKNTLDIKPEITGPGENVLSTVPGYINDKDGDSDYNIAYERMSGTSMATPHVAGLVALMVSQHENYKPADVKTVIMNTTEKLNGDYSVFEVGAGTINAYEAVKTSINIQVNDVTKTLNEEEQIIEIPDVTGDLSFGRQEKGEAVSKDFTVFNNGSEAKEFRVETVFSKSIVSPIQDPENQGVQINLPKTINVQGGKSKNATFEIIIPKLAMNGTYEGYVILTNVNDEKEDYRIPFAINVSGKFIKVEALSNMFSLGEFHPYQGAPGIWIGFEVSDVFDKLDVLIKDGETGAYVGYVGSLLTEELPTNTYLEVGPLVNYGYYCPILKDANGVDYIDPTAMKLSDDKRYTIEFLAVDKKGQIISSEAQYFVDSKAPVMKMDEGSKPGVYEIQYDEAKPDEIVHVFGNVHDDYVEYAKSYGYKISQQDNWLGYLERGNGYINQGGLTVGKNGEIAVGYPTKQINDEGLVRLSMYPIDKASNGDYKTGLENYAFIKKGMQYIQVTGEERNLKIGDTAVVSMDGKYLEDFTFGEFDAILPALESGESIYNIKSIKPTPELQKFLDDNNMKLEITSEKSFVEYGEEFITTKCQLKGDKIVGIRGDMPLLDFEVEVINQPIQSMCQIIKIGKRTNYMPDERIQYTNTQGEAQAVQVLNVSKGVINGGKSSGIGVAVPEGAIDENYSMIQTLAQMGTNIVVTAPDGTKYSGIVDYEYMGYFAFKDIPAMKGTYNVQAITPGHLSATLELRLAYEYEGGIFGTDKMNFQLNQCGGDVNADGVIDIKDALIIARAIGKNIPEVDGICRDINNDKLIGQVDLDYVVRNFGIVNGMLEGVPRAQKEFDGMNLEEVLANVGKMNETKAPEITMNLVDGKTYTSQVNLEVTSKDYVYSTHKVYVNGELFTGTTLNEDGNYELKVEATDDLGNKSTKIVNFSIKTKGPKVVINGVENGKAYNTTVKPVIITEVGTENVVTLNDKAYDGKEITTDGNYTLKVVSKDSVGNITEVVINFSIDTQGPKVVINGVENGKAYNTTVKPVIITEVGTENVVTLNDKAYDGKEITTDGNYTLKVVSKDSVGNITEVVINFSIDTQGPKVVVTGVENGKVYNTSVKPVIITEEGTENVVTLNDKVYDGKEITSDGKYILKVVSKDSAGNITESVINFSIDTQGPKVIIKGVEEGKVYDAPVKAVIITEEGTENVVTLNDKV